MDGKTDVLAKISTMSLPKSLSTFYTRQAQDSYKYKVNYDNFCLHGKMYANRLIIFMCSLDSDKVS